MSAAGVGHPHERRSFAKPWQLAILVFFALVCSSASASGSPCTNAYRYDWDEVGRLVRARRWDFAGAGTPNASSPPDADVAYTYDANGQRVLRAATASAATKKKKKSGGGGGAQETTYTAEIFSSLRLNDASFDAATNDYERTGATEAAYLESGMGTVGRVVFSSSVPSASGGAQHVYLELGDELGSTSVVVDRDSGELAERSTYLAYGGDDSDYAPDRWGDFHESYRFTGKEHDKDVGVVYFGARYYNAQLGRWMSADPLTVHGLGSDLNPYAYVRGAVTSSVDPSGLDPAEGSASNPSSVWIPVASTVVESPTQTDVYVYFDWFGPDADLESTTTSNVGGPWNVPRSIRAGMAAVATQAASGALQGIAAGELDPDTSDVDLWYRAGLEDALTPDKILKARSDKLTATVLANARDALDVGPGGSRFSRTPRLIGGVVLPVASPAAAAAEGAEAALVSRAEQIHGALDATAQGMRTTAVLDTSAGRVIASGGRDLTPGQRALLQAGEMYNTAPGVHAEVTAITGARQIGAQLRAIGTTSDFCPFCIDYIEQSGGVITGPRTAVWPQ